MKLTPPPPPGFIRAISVFEPYATAIAWELKKYETRAHPTGVRGELLICAGAKKGHGPLNVIDPSDLHHGHAVCVVDLFDCKPVEAVRPVDATERLLGNFAAGRFAWCMRNVRPLRMPVPVKGSQGFFFVPLTALRGQYKAP